MALTLKVATQTSRKRACLGPACLPLCMRQGAGRQNSSTHSEVRTGRHDLTDNEAQDELLASLHSNAVATEMFDGAASDKQFYR